MKKLIVLAGLLLAACGPSTPAPTPTPELSSIFREQLTRVMEEGTTLDSMTAQGVNYSDYQDQLAKARGAYDLAVATWPVQFAPERRGISPKHLTAGGWHWIFGN